MNSGYTISVFFSSRDPYDCSYLSMRNGSVDDVSNLSWNVDENGNEHYYGDSGTISGSSFQSADATWKNGVKTLKVYKNTKANRKKYLK